MDFSIGSKLKELRTQKKMSIAELSKLSEVSTGLISQAERDIVIPSVPSLWRLAKALDTSINYFFQEESEGYQPVLRKEDQQTLVTHNESSYYRLLCPNLPDRLLDVTEVTLKSGCSYEKKALSHEGEECGYVISGTLTVYLDGKNYILHKGDSIYFNSLLPHKYLNNSDEDCISIWAMTPRFF